MDFQAKSKYLKDQYQYEYEPSVRLSNVILKQHIELSNAE
ncbi:hypothetical protein pb186bvf_002257 [Paramecium bursaria]